MLSLTGMKRHYGNESRWLCQFKILPFGDSTQPLHSSASRCKQLPLPRRTIEARDGTSRRVRLG